MKDTRRAFLRLLRATWPGVQDAFLSSVAQVVSDVSIGELTEAIRRGDIQEVESALRLNRAAFFPLEQSLASSFFNGGRYQMSSFRSETLRMPRGARITQSFGGRNERAERLVRELSSDLVDDFLSGQGRMVQSFIRQGIEAGDNPRAMALNLAGRIEEGGRRRGGLIGLTEHESEYVRNLRAELRDPEGNGNYFRRELRDRRFDNLVAESTRTGRSLTPSQIDRIAGRYSDRLLLARAERIARTETIRALNAGRQEAAAQLIDSGSVTSDQVKRKWNDTGDGATRDSHRQADGQLTGMEEPFVVGGFSMWFPGDSSLGAPAKELAHCRCYMEIVVDFFAGLSR